MPSSPDVTQAGSPVIQNPEIDRPRRRIAHYGTFDVENYGDLLFPLLLERRLRPLGCDLIHFSPAGGPPVWQGALASRPIHEADHLEGVDGVIFGGGDLVQAGMSGVSKYATDVISAAVAYPKLWLGSAWLSQQRGIPLAWNSPGVPFSFDSRQAPVVKWACEATDYLAVRDPKSSEFLRETGFSGEIAITPDSALEVSLLWPKDDLQTIYESLFAQQSRSVPRKTIAFHLSALQGAPDEIASWVSRICQQSEAVPLFLPINRLNEDHTFQAKVAARMSDSPLILDGAELRAFAAAIAHSEYYFGLSMHGFINALSYGIKAVFVAQPRLPEFKKLEGLTSQHGLRDWILPTWEKVFSRLSVLASADVAPWKNVRASVQPGLDAHYARIHDILSLNHDPVWVKKKSIVSQKALVQLQQFNQPDGMDITPYIGLVRYQFQRELDQKQCRSAKGPTKETPVSLTVYRPQNGEYNELYSVTVQYSPGEWVDVSVEFPSGLGDGSAPIRIDPAEVPGVIEIESLSITSGREEVWAAPDSTRQLSMLKASGTAVAVMHNNLMRVYAFDDDPQIILPVELSTAPGREATLHIRIRFIEDPGMLKSLTKEFESLRRERSTLAQLLANSRQEIHELKFKDPECRECRKQLEQTKKLLEDQKSHTISLGRKFDECHQKLESIRAERVRIQKSWAWRIVKPVFRLTESLRKRMWQVNSDRAK